MNRKVVALLLACIAASGCVSESSQGTGVKVEKLSALDDTLNPNQQTQVKAEIVNYNKAPTTIESEDISLFNTGQIEVLGKTCNPDSISAAREDFNPTIACSWTIEAPDESFVEGFSSKPVSIKMNLAYSSTLENEKPLKIDFQEMQNIDSSNDIKRSISNGDITAIVTSQSPVALENPQNVNIEVENTGPGKINGSYKFTFTPKVVEESCDGTEKKPIQGGARLNCVLEASSTGVRNLFVSTSYKYEKSPNLNIEVVNK